MRLYLVRHGKAVFEGDDNQRCLSDQGREDVRKVGMFFKKAGLSVETIFHSEKKRAVETASLLQGLINPRAECAAKAHLNPEDATDGIIDEIVHRDTDLMVVGHLPFMAKLVSRLILGDENKIIIKLTAGSMAILKYDPGHSWQIESFITPELL